MSELELRILRVFGSRAKCAKAINMHPSTLSKVLNGNRPIRGSENESLTRALGVENFEDFKMLFFSPGFPFGNSRKRTRVN